MKKIEKRKKLKLKFLLAFVDRSLKNRGQRFIPLKGRVLFEGKSFLCFFDEVTPTEVFNSFFSFSSFFFFFLDLLRKVQVFFVF